jgi:uncharacterized membrane protein YeiH
VPVRGVSWFSVLVSVSVLVLLFDCLSFVGLVVVQASGGGLVRDLWASKLSKLYRGCSNASDRFASMVSKSRIFRFRIRR